MITIRADCHQGKDGDVLKVLANDKTYYADFFVCSDGTVGVSFYDHNPDNKDEHLDGKHQDVLFNI